MTRVRSSLGWICAAVDLALFEVLLARGVFFGVAHVASFAIAMLTGLALMRGSLIDRAFMGIIAAAALLLRGGVLAMFVKTFHVPAAWAILPAIAVSAATIKCGASLKNVSAENRWRTLALAALLIWRCFGWFISGRPSFSRRKRITGTMQSTWTSAISTTRRWSRG